MAQPLTHGTEAKWIQPSLFPLAHPRDAIHGTSQVTVGAASHLSYILALPLPLACFSVSCSSPLHPGLSLSTPSPHAVLPFGELRKNSDRRKCKFPRGATD